MIETLLRRIMRRRESPAQQPLSVLAPGSHGHGHGHSHGSVSSSAGAGDPFSTTYPAPGRHRYARSGLTEPGAQSAWALACEAYISRRINGGRIADQPAYFALWGVAHMAVAQMLWAERERLHLGEATIYSGNALLAVVQPKKLKVWIHPATYQNTQPLTLRQLPLGQAAALAEPQKFSSCAMYSLLWFYGQVYSHAPDLLPPEMGQQLIQLRRFPAVEPAALEMRHLALIHVFSGGALGFAQLQKHISPEFESNLCADLASLYFTGALRLLP